MARMNEEMRDSEGFFGSVGNMCFFYSVKLLYDQNNKTKYRIITTFSHQHSFEQNIIMELKNNNYIW